MAIKELKWIAITAVEIQQIKLLYDLNPDSSKSEPRVRFTLEFATKSPPVCKLTCKMENINGMLGTECLMLHYKHRSNRNSN